MLSLLLCSCWDMTMVRPFFSSPSSCHTATAFLPRDASCSAWQCSEETDFCLCTSSRTAVSCRCHGRGSDSQGKLFIADMMAICCPTFVSYASGQLCLLPAKEWLRHTGSQGLHCLFAPNSLSLHMQDFQKAFFPSVYEHSVHPDPSPADAVQAAYCKCAHFPLIYLCGHPICALWC